jgi:hypothetical protein
MTPTIDLEMEKTASGLIVPSDCIEKPQEIAIPKAAQEEVNRLHQDILKKFKEFNEARSAFIEFLHITKNQLNISLSEPWDIKDDGSAFIKVESVGDVVKPVAPTLENAANSVTEEVAESQEKGNVLKAKDIDPDPGDVTD